MLDERQKNYVYSFIKKSDDLNLNEMAAFAAEKKIPILDELSLQFLKQLFTIKKPKFFLEIGAAICYSTISLAKIADWDLEFVALEKSSDNYKLAKEFITKNRLENKINLILCEAKDYLKTCNREFDFIFLDADKEDYEELFYLSIENLNTEGIIFVDNLLWHGYAAESIERIPQNFLASSMHIKKFNQIFIEDKRLFSQIYPIGDGIGVGIKK